jgi:mono/diheme cytochrome c family protein
MAHLCRFVAWELGLAALILAVTSGLALTAPARHDAPYWPLSYRLAYDVMAERPGVKTRLLVGSQIAVLGLVGGAAALFLKRQAALLLAAAVAAVVAGLWVALPPLAVDAYPTTYLRSTVPYQAASIASGIDLYFAHCATCHGRGGSGDGPGGAGLPRRPADLTAPHTGQHTAGDLFWWLTHDPPGACLSGALTAEDRWDLINFLRALSAGRSAHQGRWSASRAWLRGAAFSVGPSRRDLKNCAGSARHLSYFLAPDSARVAGSAEMAGGCRPRRSSQCRWALAPNTAAFIIVFLYPSNGTQHYPHSRCYSLLNLNHLLELRLKLDRPAGLVRARWIPGAAGGARATSRSSADPLREVRRAAAGRHVHCWRSEASGGWSCS